MRAESVVFTRLYHLILQKFGTIKNFSEATFYNQTTVARRLRGQAMFTSTDIKDWCSALEIPQKEIPFYFFQDMEKERNP